LKARNERRNSDASDQEARGADRAGRRHHEVELNAPGPGGLAGQKAGAVHRPGAAILPECSPPQRPRLKETIELIPGSDGVLYLYRGGEDDFSVDGTHALVRQLLSALDGSRTMAELLELAAGDPRLATDVADAISQLHRLGLVEDAAADEQLPPRDRERYERQLRYFGDLAPPAHPRAAYQARLSDARVAILGLGGLGGWAAYALAASGVGCLDLVDGDCVELSNLNRQVLYRESDIGQPKAYAAERSLRSLNQDIQLHPLQRMLGSRDDVAAVIRDADFVIDAVDYPPHQIEHWVNEACFAQQTPYVMMSQFPPMVRLGPTFIPGTTGCYRCQETAWRAQFARFDDVIAGREGVPCPAAAIGAACGLIGSQIAVDIIHFLTGLATPATQGTALLVDLRVMSIERMAVARDPDCSVCGAV
jgi:bacteriocin biosynthesis cyclodehydratase domain-containing protein